MSKGITFVVVYSIFLIVLFGVLCYLMTTINPEPLIETHKMKAVTEDFNDAIYLNDVLFPTYKTDYALGKISAVEDSTMFALTTMSPIYKYVSKKSFQNSEVYRKARVIPPVLPKLTNLHIKKLTKAINTKFENISKKIYLSTSSSRIKGMRRSVNNSKPLYNDDDLNSVVLKILDEKGESKIEIKLDSINSLEERRLKEISNYSYRSELKPKFSVSIKVNESQKVEKVDLTKDTIIRVMPNNTLIVNELNNALQINKSWFKDKTTYDKKNTSLNEKEDVRLDLRLKL